MMNPDDFILEQQGTECIGALAEIDAPDDEATEPVFLIGALFMKNVLTVFDLAAPAVGFGKLKNASFEYGTNTVISNEQATALGTGPFASSSPTFVPTTPAGKNLNG
jgi:hypothetical protein